MSRPLFRTLLAAGTVTILAALPTGAFAIGGTSDNGDSYINDAQKNPRFIEPYAWANPSRYRASNPQFGYDDRQWARRGYSDDVYAERRARGRVRVAPYSDDE